MKKLILFLLFCFYFLGGTFTNVYAYINKYINEAYKFTNPEAVEVYSLSIKNIKRPYIEIAEIMSISTKDVSELKKIAAKLGADAIFIVDRSSYRAVAIKYIDNIYRTALKNCK
ncbi:MAG: undecaprenyl diphosphate synthase family protein [Endomicrobium sp.]|jgi:undecaprenyl pyrophosphate synthase|nr:undecaprenyl diphosphate synthase family protein [Endomicrobium sp.]